MNEADDDSSNDRDAAIAPGDAVHGGRRERLAYLNQERFRWNIPRSKSYAQESRSISKHSLMLAGICAIALAGAVGVIARHYALSMNDYLELLTATLGAAAMFVGVIWFGSHFDLFTERLFGNRGCVTPGWIDLKVGTRTTKFHWNRIVDPKVIATMEAPADRDASCETGRIEFKYRLSNGSLQETSVPIYGDVDLLALQAYAQEHGARA